jgi:hypothetical protein
MKFLTALSVLLFCFFVAAPGYANDINDEGAEKLKTLFGDLLTLQKSVTELDGLIEFHYDGNVTVEPADTYYAVTLPHIKILYPEGTELEMGMISINASPHAKEKQWKMAIAMPTPMIMRDENGKELARLSIQGQQAAGIWHEDFNSFTKLDAKYQNIVLRSIDPPFTATIPETRLRYDLDEDENNLWSGPALAAFKDMNIVFPNGAEAKIGTFKFEVTIDQLVPAIWNNYKEAVKKLADIETPEDNAAQITELTNLAFELFTEGLNGVSSSYTMMDGRLNLPETLTGKADEIRLGNASFGFDLHGFRENRLSFTLDMGYDGFEQASMPADLKDIVPDHMQFNTSLKNIPVRQLVELGQNTFQAGMANPEGAQLLGLSLMIKIPALLAQYGTVIEFKDNNVGNDLYEAALDGTLRADLSAVNSVTGDAKMTFRGLDDALSRARALAEKPNTDYQEQVRQFVSNLEMLRSFGKKEGSAYVYDFLMNPQGQILLNGQDMRTMFFGGAMPVPMQPRPEQAPQDPPR